MAGAKARSMVPVEVLEALRRYRSYWPMGCICLANVAIESAATRSHTQIAAHTRYSVPRLDEKYYLSVRPIIGKNVV
jgi:hypothetical protein